MLSLAFIAQSYLKEHGTARFSTSGYFNSLCFHQNKDILSCFLPIFLQLLKIDINIHTVGAVTEPELEKKSMNSGLSLFIDVLMQWTFVIV